ncbi:MAG: hypothetical protein KDC53_13735 [Saprospiraceae bacterium]|nr:hypothetical protein [Saprospiraceae bacterium]
MKIHLIAIGGSIMHNLAICLQKAGHNITGSDDEIYEPAKSRLAALNLLPPEMGWHPEQLAPDIDLVILGMHAKADNPELVKAQELGIKIMSFPEYIGAHSVDKKRIVVAGSHGKTTTTSMILHVLKYWAIDCDYLVGAQLKGFETMVRLSDAPIIVIEGDEYLSSSIDRVPKIWHYYPDISIVTGVAWDHMNVFPTLEAYYDAFRGYFDRMPSGAKVFYDAKDPFLSTDLPTYDQLESIPYEAFKHTTVDGKCILHMNYREVPLRIFGQHNLSNLKGAYHVVKELGISDSQFMEAIGTFEGAAKRLQLRRETKDHLIYQDFAHAPSKVKATVAAMKSLYPDRKLMACVELHTFSSLNKEFLPQYKDSLAPADQAVVFYSEHTLSMKGMPPLSPEIIRQAFGREDLIVLTDRASLKSFIENQKTWTDRNLLLMSSGTFDALVIDDLKTV